MIQREDSARAHRSPEGPVRTCVGCRKRELAAELLRILAVPDGAGVGQVADADALVVDTAGNLPGRGAWLHPDQQCLTEAIRRRAFTRALRITGSPDTTVVVEHWQSLAAPPAARS